MKTVRCKLPPLTRSNLITLAIVIIIIALLHFVIQFEQQLHGDFSNLDFPGENLASPRSLTPLEEFPESGKTRIPKIIHQTWANTKIPNSLVPYIKSWVTHHPDWEYWFWTDDSARELIADKFPEYLSMFDSYTEGIRKADALRYFVLYEYGGVYSDLDLENLQSVEPMTRKYSCFIGQEPWEHPILDSNFEGLAINAIMGCNKKHPFMKFVMENLPNFAHMWNVLDSTGPHFITLLYRSYIKSVKEPLDPGGIYLAPAEYFFPTLDPMKFFYFKQKCYSYKSLSRLQQKACMSLKLNGMIREPLSYSFTVHHWIHTYLGFSFNFFQSKTDISEVVPSFKMYGMKSR